MQNSIKIQLKQIEPGSFMMGSPENEKGRYDSEFSSPGNHQQTFLYGHLPRYPARI